MANLTNSAKLIEEMEKKVNSSSLSTVATSGSYTDLSNKPTIPTVNDSTITVQKNGTDVDSFTTYVAVGKTINIQLIKADVGLGSVDNTSDANKPVSLATWTELNKKANSADVYTQAQTDSAISAAVSSVYKVKGSVNTYADLANISSPTTGDVYNVIDTDMNYVWNGTAWDPLGTSVDLSNYLAKNNTTAFTPTGDYNPATKKYVDDVAASCVLPTTEPLTPAIGQMWYDTGNGQVLIWNGAEWQATGGSGGGAYLDPISNLVAAAGNAQVSLTWTDPDDVVISGHTLAKWKCTKLVRKVGSAPTEVSDGTLVATFTTRNGHTSTPYVDTGVENGTTYYYVAFAISNSNEATESNSASVTPQAYRTLTLSYTEGATPAFADYSDDAAGWSAGSTDFDEFFGYYGCRLNTSGQETATITQAQSGGNGKLDITQLGALTSGDNVMIAFPRRGIKMSKSGSTVTISVTDDPNKEGFQYYAFTRGTTVKDRFYLSAYKASRISNVLKSYSGQGAAGSASANGISYMSLDTACSHAQANGAGYDCETWRMRNYINALFVLKNKTLNSQSKIGAGYTGGYAAQSTGATNSIIDATGATNTSSTGRIKLFGLEDWRGNVWEWLNGAYYNSSTSMQLGTLPQSPSGKITNFSYYDAVTGTSSTAAITVASGWMSSAVASNAGMFASNGTSGSESTYYCDPFGVDSGYSLLAGGYWNGGTYAGAFHVNTSAASTAYSHYGARLAFL